MAQPAEESIRDWLARLTGEHATAFRRGIPRETGFGELLAALCTALELHHISETLDALLATVGTRARQSPPPPAAASEETSAPIGPNDEYEFECPEGTDRLIFALDGAHVRVSCMRGGALHALTAPARGDTS